ncbi:MAG: hypothetical protein O7J95_08880, partial [Planctomycetota bacterium]|nr:hypothetical protein [Planctomycetota bacterium]
NGNAFTVSGNDHFMNGFPTGDPAKALAGLATTTSDPPGTNYDALMAQIRLENYDQIEGAGGTPAVGEVEAFDLNQIAEQFLIAETQDLAPGTYTGLNIASLTPGNVVVTHVAGDLRLSGSGEGSGVLIVDGDLRVSGSFEFTGLVIVRGDMRAVGGGSGIHVIGGVMIGEPVDAQTPSEMKIAGNADFVYSSEVMDIIQGVLNDNPTYEGVYYDENRNPGTPGTPQETPQETTQDPAPQPAE